ncbi:MULTISPECIES: hypothetical protein [Sphingomonas]|jgi:hypothetical protein|uniref:Uncharacterized protein n=1 Tax=Sphingomonas turrisvirgatae TaxID=1888892 RepID=A0A1E3LYY4_9SPHN|nr:hypothetical protein [Sphingomonas turrisvirgatae]ODP38929.1 hypothetical protein BFL28_12785 [Sphingomonas turrisvirgatae]
MNVQSILQTATVLLLLTALGGVAMAVQRLTRNQNPPNWLAMAHGLLAAAAFGLLLYASFQDDVPGSAATGIVILLVAAGGGIVMNLHYHLAGKLIPQWLLHLHILLGVVGTTLVAWGAWGAPTL